MNNENIILDYVYFINYYVYNYVYASKKRGNMEEFYVEEWTEDSNYQEEYEMLKGPNGFKCLLTEPEDRSWFRDLESVIDKLNEQYERIKLLESKVKP